MSAAGTYRKRKENDDGSVRSAISNRMRQCLVAISLFFTSPFIIDSVQYILKKKTKKKTKTDSSQRMKRHKRISPDLPLPPTDRPTDAPQIDLRLLDKADERIRPSSISLPPHICIQIYNIVYTLYVCVCG